MAPEAGKAETPTPPGAFTDAANRIRDSAKWLLGAFAAVGALLAAGLQLADLGALSGTRSDSRLSWSVAGVSLALLGVGIAIGAASAVVTRSFVTLEWLQSKDRRHKDLSADSVLLADQADVPTLYRNFSDALQKQKQAVDAYDVVPSDQNKQTLVAKANVVKYYDNIANRVVERASYLRLARTFLVARFGMLFGAAVAAAGITLFAWAANPPSDSLTPVVVKTPSEVRVTFSDEGKAQFAPLLGAGCDLSVPRPALAVRDIGENYELAMVPDSKCKAVLITVTPAQGQVRLPSGNADGQSSDEDASPD